MMERVADGMTSASARREARVVAAPTAGSMAEIVTRNDASMRHEQLVD
jgi:hypothetical protein